MRNSMIRSLVFALFVFGLSTTAEAAIITSCGASQGFAYFFAGGLVGKNESGWKEDGITGGRLLLIRDGTKFDIVFTDATKGTRSAKADGATIIFLGGTNPFVIMESYMTAAGPSVTIYSFQVDRSGSGHVVWSQAKANGIVNKSAIYRAECTAPR